MDEISQLARTMALECPALRVRQASRVLTKLFDGELAPFGLLSSQLPILAAVALFGDSGAPMSRLAEALLMDRTTLTRGIQPLKRARASTCGALAPRCPHEDCRHYAIWRAQDRGHLSRLGARPHTDQEVRRGQKRLGSFMRGSIM